MLLYDLVDMQELQGFVRTFQAEIERDTFTLSRFLPNNNIDDIEYRVTRNRRQDQDAATIRAWDTEAPIAARRAAMERLMGELPPISRKIRLGEEERLRRRSIERGGNTDGIVDAVYDDAGNMARAVTARVEMLRAEALLNAELDIDENGVVQTVDFDRDPELEVDAAGPFSDPTAEVVSELVAWLKVYQEINDGARPGRILASDRILGGLLFNEQIRALAGTNEAAPQLISPNAVANVFQAYGIPPMEAIETHVRVNGVRQRILPDNVLIFVPPNARDLGETLSGTTAEALELVGARQLEADQAPGLTAVVEKTFDPVATWTKAAAISLPVLWDANLTMRATVIPAE